MITQPVLEKNPKTNAPNLQACRFHVYGTVQGVGFRPAVYRLAKRLGIQGKVRNIGDHVCIVAEGTAEALNHFQHALQTLPHANISKIRTTKATPIGFKDFTIAESNQSEQSQTTLPPDIAPCDKCLQECNDPTSRRHHYPFITCAQCGPRYSITDTLPFDREHTAMAAFPMCSVCLEEYNDPENRRFHAESIACPSCGPKLALWNSQGEVIATTEDAFSQAVDATRQGKILALKGLGGFQLLANAEDADAIQRLRKRKHRPAKPFAVMYPDVEQIRKNCLLSPEEEVVLTSPAAPIVLLQTRANAQITENLSPNTGTLGVMLPTTPLHHLLLQALAHPIVATSGNRSGDPICMNEQDALRQLADIADLFLVHDRHITRRVDDSIVRVIGGRPMQLRRARGYTMLPLTIPVAAREPVLAVGGQLKNTVAMAVGNQLILSPHIGDMNTPATLHAHRKTINALEQFTGHTPRHITHDAHPDYQATRNAQQHKTTRLIPVQHHVAHIYACMLDNGISEECLGVAWDGTGYGNDGTIWGGEFLKIKSQDYQRISHLLPFPLPGREKAIREPRRVALGLLYTCYGDAFHAVLENLPHQLFTPVELSPLTNALSNRINCPQTSSIGRLFDAVAALTGLCSRNRHEGEAAMALEAAAIQASEEPKPYLFPFENGVLDWRPMLHTILQDITNNIPVSNIADRFHYTLAIAIATVAKTSGDKDILLTGGCFQNKTLTEYSIDAIRAAGLTPYWHQNIPPNDGGLAAGQAMAAIREMGECA